MDFIFIILVWPSRTAWLLPDTAEAADRSNKVSENKSGSVLPAAEQRRVSRTSKLNGAGTHPILAWELESGALPQWLKTLKAGASSCGLMDGIQMERRRNSVPCAKRKLVKAGYFFSSSCLAFAPVISMYASAFSFSKKSGNCFWTSMNCSRSLIWASTLANSIFWPGIFS